MRESKGKRAARKLFYNECLPSWLSDRQLRSGDFLVLLGDEPRELPLLDELGIPRNHIWSIERDEGVYYQQLEQSLGTSLYFGEMAEYLEHMLHTNQAFMVLNLDVEGSYLSQLDAAMSSVLLFCWRNPETVVATYSSIGRDTELLWEGIKSLAIFSWFNSELAMRVLGSLTARYHAMGFTQPLRMALRDLFWLRSHMEHIATTSAAVDVTEPGNVQKLYELENEIWSAIAECKHTPLRLGQLEKIVQGVQQRSKLEARLGIDISRMHNVTYNAEPPWSQRCYFSKFQITQTPSRIRPWLIKALFHLQTAPFTYINHDGQRQKIAHPDHREPFAKDIVLWERDDLYTKYNPRCVSLVPTAPHLIAMNQTLCSIRERMRYEAESKPDIDPTGANSVKEQEQDMPDENDQDIRFFKGGAFTEAGKARIRELAIQGLSTEEIMGQIREDVPERRLRALVAVARRPYGGRKFMRDGELTEFGLETIRDLARQGLNTDEIRKKIPSSVPRCVITAHVAVSRRKSR